MMTTSELTEDERLELADYLRCMAGDHDIRLDGLCRSVERIIARTNTEAEARLAAVRQLADEWDYHDLNRPYARRLRAAVGTAPTTDAETVEVVRGFITHDDGSHSPVERWVKASDDRWVSLDSERQTRRDLTWVMDEGCDCAELCEMGPTCPGGGLAGLPGAGCHRTAPTTDADDIERCLVCVPRSCRECWKSDAHA
jgi:hypothetical protein